MNRTILKLLPIAAAAALPVFAQDTGHKQEPDQATVEKVFKQPGYSPYAGRNFPTNVYWGNQHIHTSLSMDAGAIGCKIDDEGCYRFSRGEEVVSSTGQRVQLSRPMDWVVISDHAEAYGGMIQLLKGNPLLLADPTLSRRLARRAHRAAHRGVDQSAEDAAHEPTIVTRMEFSPGTQPTKTEP